MTYDLRYDGPDVEAEVSNRTTNVLMGATMVLDGLTGAVHSRKQAAAGAAAQRDAAALHADQAVWADTPTGADLAGLDDDGIARRWAACAAHPDQPDANQVRARLEAELTGRDPDTMRDYRSWRAAAGLGPGEAMRRALAEREHRLRQEWQPLTGPGVAGMAGDEVATRWAAAHTAHGHPDTAEDLTRARVVGAARLHQLDPGLLDAWAAAQAEQPSPVTGLGTRPGLTPAAAAAGTTGRPAAFLPSPGGAGTGWGAVASTGVRVASTAARTAAVANPAGVVVTGAQWAAGIARHTQQVLNRGLRP